MPTPPTPSKTHQWPTKNSSVATTGNATTDHQQTVLAILNGLLGAASSGGVVRSSSNSVTASAANNVTANANFVWGTGAHTWFVVRFTGMGPTFDVCFDLNNSTVSALAIYFSPGGYATTGLSTSARPATLNNDEVPITGTTGSPVSQWISVGSSTFSGFVNVDVTTDGQSLFWFVASTTGSVMHVTWIHKLQNAPASLTYPYAGGSLGTADQLTYANLSASAVGTDQTTTTTPSSVMRMNAATGNSALARVSWGGVFFNGQHAGQQITAVSSLDGAWPASPIEGFANSILPSGYSHGYVGEVPDMWFGSTGVASGDTFAGKTFLQLNNLIIVWPAVSPSGFSSSVDLNLDVLAGVADQGALGGAPLASIINPPVNHAI